MGIFQKLGGKIGHIFRKGTNEVGSAFKKSASTIGRGLGSLAGSALGGAAFESAALALAPELAVPALLAGKVVGGAVGGELGKRTGKELTRDKPRVPTAGQMLHNVQRAHERQGAMKIPDGKFFQGTGGKTGQRGQKSIPDSKYFRQPVRVGENGGGQRRITMTPEEKGNELEKKRTAQPDLQRFV